MFPFFLQKFSFAIAGNPSSVRYQNTNFLVTLFNEKKKRMQQSFYFLLVITVTLKGEDEERVWHDPHAAKR